jgi:hypothetical protein
LNAIYTAGLNTDNFQLDLNVNTFDRNNYSVKLYPSSYISMDVSYKDILFKKKLKLRTGFNVKYISDKPEVTYDQFANVLIPVSSNAGFENFDVDFYVGARIGKANINITLANLLNSLFYNTSIYPFDERNGFLRTISRFTITWDFWN